MPAGGTAGADPVRDSIISRAGAQALKDLAGLREAVLFMLAEDPPAVQLHVEDAAAAGDQSDVLATLPLEEVRQTGGPGQVVSDLAVGDADGHGMLLSTGRLGACGPV
jgi:hypothetical protein